MFGAKTVLRHLHVEQLQEGSEHPHLVQQEVVVPGPAEDLLLSTAIPKDTWETEGAGEESSLLSHSCYRFNNLTTYAPAVSKWNHHLTRKKPNAPNPRKTKKAAAAPAWKAPSLVPISCISDG